MLKLLLYPLSVLYGIVVYVRNLFYDYKVFKSVDFEIPVISIGNITVGGTGKTPHTEYLVSLLNKYVSVATLSRGYRRKTKGFLSVGVESRVTDVGDEPLQIKRKYPEVTVAVDENRVHGIRQLLDDQKRSPDVVLLDDAFQHRRVNPGINILLIDYDRPVEKDHLMPYGRLRERKYQLRRANVIIYTKCPDEISPITRRIVMKNINLRPYQSLYFTTMVYHHPVPVFQEYASESVPDFEQQRLNAVLLSGIANPDQFEKYIHSRTNVIRTLTFSDHHFYGSRDIQKINQAFESVEESDLYLFTTEKDAMRLHGEEQLSEQVKRHLYYIPLRIRFLDSEGKSFDQKIVGYVKDNRSNRRLYQQKDKS